MSEDGTSGYKIGPTDEMKREIGQVVINHAYSENALKGLFIVLARLEKPVSEVVMKNFNPKGIPITKAVTSLIDDDRDISSLVKLRIQEVVADYKRLSEARNIYCHWAWGMSENGRQEAIVYNDQLGYMEKNTPRTVTLHELKTVAFSLAQIVGAIHLLTSLIGSGMPEKEVFEAFSGFDSIILKVKEAVLSLPAVINDESD